MSKKHKKAKRAKKPVISMAMPRMERAKMYGIENEKLLIKYGLMLKPTTSFPRRTRLPFLSRIALKIIRRQGGHPDIRIDDFNER